MTVNCGNQTLRIVNGKMILNDADRGQVQQGDIIITRPASSGSMASPARTTRNENRVPHRPSFISSRPPTSI